MTPGHTPLLVLALLLAALAGSAAGAALAPYQPAKTWDGSVPGSGQPGYLQGIAVDGGGTVYVSSGLEDGIATFTSDGTYLSTVRAPGGERMTDPSELAADGAGNLYLADWRAAPDGRLLENLVVKLAPNGGPMTTVLSVPGEKKITDLAVDPAGRLHVYLDASAAGGATVQDEIRVFSPAGAPERTLVLPDSAGPSLAVLPDGRYLVSHFYEVRVLDAAGTLLETWGAGWSTGNRVFDGIDDMAVGPQGLVFVVEYPRARVRAVSPAGEVLASWPIESDPGDDGGERKSVATDGDGNVYVASAVLGKVQTFSPPGGAGTAPTATAVPGTATYAAARASYAAGGAAWSRAWGASEIGEIREHLARARAEYAAALSSANAAVDPANGANLALVRTISGAYVDLADAALAMYDGADVYAAGRARMAAADYGAAATSFGEAAGRFDSSRALFSRATATLRSAVYTGTEFGDGTAYTAAIVPVLDAKGAYMGEFGSYARGWEHAALAFRAYSAGDRGGFLIEADRAIALFDGLGSSAAFGADAAANREILAGMAAGA
ncbi:MAG: hypothetical protein GXY82_05900 [Methanospirillum sp.]|nr:hypothetical protein [Methanospirillum sp.]